MAQPSSILHADRGRASATAWGILCFLVVLQSIMVVYLFMNRPKAAPEPVAALAPTMGEAPRPGPVAPPLVRMSPPPVGSLVPTIVAPAPSPSTMAPPPIGSLGSPAQPQPTRTPPPAAVPPPNVAPSAPLAPPPAARSTGLPPPGTGLKRLPFGDSPAPASGAADLSVKEMVDLAKQVRSLGDMQQALETLNKADLRYPDDPAVQAEMAQTYELMGLTDKSTAIWRRLEAMNPQQAAGYRDMATRRLAAGPSSATKSNIGPLGGIVDVPKVLALGACVATRDASVMNGEKVVLRIPLLRQGSTSIDPSQVDIDVYFFDRVNGEKVAQTIADDPVTAWGAPPVDWSGIGEEPLNVTYFLPQLTPGEVQAHGRRSYHGYLVKLYYQHKLQDVAAEPRDLLDYGSNMPEAGSGAGNPLLPPVSQ